MTGKVSLSHLCMFITLLMVVTACIPTQPDLNATATQAAMNQFGTQTAAVPTVFIPTPTATLVLEPIPSQEASPTPVPPPQTDLQFIAYIRDGQLLVTDVTNGVQGGTTQYTVTGESDQVTDLVWSPSGEFVAFVSTAKGEPHLFYIFALGQSSPTDLGPGSSPAWSPDSQYVAVASGIDTPMFLVDMAEKKATRINDLTPIGWLVK